MIEMPTGRLELRYIRADLVFDVSITSLVEIESLASFVEPFRALLAAVGFDETTLKELLEEP